MAVAMVPNIDKIRFVNSVQRFMSAVRPRIYKRDKIIKLQVVITAILIHFEAEVVPLLWVTLTVLE
jgi:hypothetical protein